MDFSIPQAASAIGVMWLDAPAAFSVEDAPHILGLYRYDFTGAVPPEPPPVAGSTGGGGGWPSGGRISPEARRRLSRVVDEVWKRKFGPHEPPPAEEMAEEIVERVVEALPAAPNISDIVVLRMMLPIVARMMDLHIAEQIERDERDAEETALLIALNLV